MLSPVADLLPPAAILEPIRGDMAIRFGERKHKTSAISHNKKMSRSCWIFWNACLFVFKCNKNSEKGIMR